MKLLLAWIAGWLVILVVIAIASWAHSPEDTDPAMASWFRSLAVPGTDGSSCCSEKDCYTVKAEDLRVGEDGYSVRDPEGQGFLRVPDNHILQRWDNPTGKYVACVVSHHVLCFVKAAGI